MEGKESHFPQGFRRDRHGRRWGRAVCALSCRPIGSRKRTLIDQLQQIYPREGAPAGAAARATAAARARLKAAGNISGKRDFGLLK